MAHTTVVPVPVMGKHNVNAFLLLGRRAVLVDTGIPGSGAKILARIAEHGIEPGDVSAIVITHAHIDHFGSAAELRRATGAPVVAHIADIGPYTTGRIREPYLPTGRFGRFLDRLDAFHEHAEPFRPDLLVDGPTTLYEHGVDARIMPTPGHTAGSMSVLTDAGDLVAGDLVATSFLGTARRRPANPPFHDDPVGNLASLRAMLGLKPTTLHVGHGGPLDPARVECWAAREQHRLDRLAARGLLHTRAEPAPR
ncbi:MBL fold metallo-hydrolase [Streptomyces sp. CB01881]|uniref:MBL fold metallo-hydrolase n=1 Tax=Streptomyces sp. CB01881 TaxID=2078691 RepID=UPI000CDBF9B5|nr:MBL fold metallo-hydrolase [Streptomyces sp. CB01881]AUY52632.1 MBL fold metallo-hydrolase [Streptomyces sp. CB01881]TYC70351.1 MBL fold metallo-hydrolase [Streptomyces sp. CB01881]